MSGGMYRLRTPGLLIAVEGIDAAGSSTLVRNLAQAMLGRGLATVATKEPTDNLIGGLIRGALTKEWGPSLRTVQQLFVADRSHHLDRVIIPNLRKGTHVVTDRYIWSTLAFGQVGLERSELLAMNAAYPEADVTLLIDIEVDTTQQRLDRRDHIELFERRRTQEQVRENYLTLAHGDAGATVLDGRRSEVDLTADALAAVLAHPLLGRGERDAERDLPSGDPDIDPARIYHGWQA